MTEGSEQDVRRTGHGLGPDLVMRGTPYRTEIGPMAQAPEMTVRAAAGLAVGPGIGPFSSQLPPIS